MKSQKLQVLLVENSKDDAELILREIRRGGYKVESARVETRYAMQKALKQRRWDIIICKNTLPLFDAMKAVAVLKESGFEIPLIIISDTIDEEAAVAVLNANVSDLLVKGSLTRLVPAIRREMKNVKARREWKLAEDAVQRMQDRFQALIENAPDGIALIDSEGRLQLVSPSARKMFGFDKEDEIEITPFDYVHPDDSPIVLSMFSGLLEKPGLNPSIQFRFKHKNGSWRWIEGTFTNLLDVKNVKAIVINFRDITARKQSGERLQRQLARLAALREVDQLIAATFDLRISLNTLLSRAIHFLDVDAAAVLLLHPVLNVLEYGIGIGFRTDAIHNTNVKLGKSLAGKVARERRILRIRNTTNEMGNLFLTHDLKGEDFVDYYGAPLIVKGKVVGVLEVFGRSPIDDDRDWQDFFSTLAGQAAIMVEDARMFNELQVANIELSLAYDATIEGWSRALDLRDKETEGHTQRVTELTMKLARQMSFPEKEMGHIRRGALLHDIGKLGVPDHILWKADSLTETEWEVMRKHPTFAYDLLMPIRYLKSAAIDIPYCHHEKWDGTGYPRRLKGEEIPLSARLFAIVDVWDALTSDRPYRPAWTKDKAREFIHEQSGKQFDPQVADAFIKMIESL